MNPYAIPGLKVERNRMFEKIINEVSEYCIVDNEDLRSKSSKQELVFARHLCCYFLRLHTNKSHRYIANYFGYKTHSSVIDAVKAVNNHLDGKDGKITKAVNEIKKKL